MNTQTRWEEQIEARITAKEVPPLQVTWDRDYSNTGTMRVWHDDTQTLVFEVQFNWQSGTLNLAAPSHSDGPSITGRKLYRPTDLAAAQDFVFSQVVDSAIYLLDGVA